MLSRMRTLIFCLLAALFFSVSPTNAAIRIVASLPDLGSIASYIGGDRVEVLSIAKANANPHSVEVFPSYMAKVSKAAIYLKCGLGLDQWANEIIDGSRNNKIVVIDCSHGVPVLDKPAGKVDASMGDVHPFGNPHYWLNPANGIIIAQNIAAALQKADPANSSVYAANLETFTKECNTKFVAWQAKMKPFAGAKIITYHSSWVYLADAFGLTIVAQVEPFPGIPPSGKHLARLVRVIKEDGVAFIIQEPYFSDDAPRFLNRQTGVKVFKSAPACSNVKPMSYFEHFESIVNQIVGASGEN